MAPRARVDEVGFFHGFDDVLEDLVRRDVSIDLVDDAEGLDVEMSERVVLNAVVRRHFEVRHEMIPVVVIGYRIEKRDLVELLFVDGIDVIVNDRAPLIVNELALVQDPDLAAVGEDADHVGRALYGEVAVHPVGIVGHRDVGDGVLYVSDVRLYVVIKFDGIEIRSVEIDGSKAGGIADAAVALPVFDADHGAFNGVQEKQARLVVSAESIGQAGDLLFDGPLVERVDVSLARGHIVKHSLGFVQLVEFVDKHVSTPVTAPSVSFILSDEERLVGQTP